MYVEYGIKNKGEQAASMRRQIGEVRSFGIEYLEDKDIRHKHLVERCLSICRTLPHRFLKPDVTLCVNKLYGEMPPAQLG